MKKLFENWQNYLQEEEINKVMCNCRCTDCVFNKNQQCNAEKINLNFAQTAAGKTICECLTYDVRDDESSMDAVPFDEEPTLEES